MEDEWRRSSESITCLGCESTWGRGMSVGAMHECIYPSKQKSEKARRDRSTTYIRKIDISGNTN